MDELIDHWNTELQDRKQSHFHNAPTAAQLQFSPTAERLNYYGIIFISININSTCESVREPQRVGEAAIFVFS